MKKLLSLVLALLLMLTCIPITARAEQIASGTCGDGLTWTLDDMGHLTISGTGSMEDHEDPDDAPWSAYKSSVFHVTIGEGVTQVGNYAFSGFTYIKELSLPSTLKRIGYRAFENCTGLTELALPEGLAYITACIDNDRDHYCDICGEKLISEGSVHLIFGIIAED